MDKYDSFICPLCGNTDVYLNETENYLNKKKVSVKPTKLGLWSD